MSLRPQSVVPPVPDDTARVTRAAFRRGNPYVLLRDRLGGVFDDAGFADLYPTLGQPAYAPWRLALVTLMQFREGLSDRQAADAVRGRIDWKYLLALDLNHVQFETHGRSAWLGEGRFPYDGFPEKLRSGWCCELIMNTGDRRWRTCAAWP